MAQNLRKNTSCTVQLCYQVNLAVDIPDIIENNKNLHLITYHHGVSEIFILITGMLLVHVLIGQISSIRKVLGTNLNLSENTVLMCSWSSSISFNIISIGRFIVNVKGLQVRVSKFYLLDLFISLKISVLVNSVDPDEMLHSGKVSVNRFLAYKG